MFKIKDKAKDTLSQIEMLHMIYNQEENRYFGTKERNLVTRLFSVMDDRVWK